MRVLIYAPQGTGAMRELAETLATHLASHADVLLYRPDAAGELREDRRGRITLVPFRASRSRAMRGVAHFNPVRQVREAQRIRSYRPDLIHIFNGEGNLMPALALRMMPEIPMLVTVHDPVAHPGAVLDRALVAMSRLLVLPRAAGIHVFAEIFRQDLIRRGVASERIHVARHGTLAEVFTRFDTGAIEREDAALLFGRLEYYKGVDVLVDAGLALSARGKSRRIIIAGPGRMAAAVRAKIISHSEIFELHNYFVPDHQAAVLFKRARICVLPYRAASQSSLPAIAQAYGQKIIASRSGAFAEEIPQLGGVLVTPGSIQELADALADCSPAKVAPGDSGPYAWPEIVAAMLEAYRSTMRNFSYTPKRLCLRTRTSIKSVRVPSDHGWDRTAANREGTVK